MTTITQQEFKAMLPQSGGDYWNEYRVAWDAFAKHPEAHSITFSVGSGLWVDVLFNFNDGSTKMVKLFH